MPTIEEIKKELDDLVEHNGKGVHRRGERNRKQYYKENAAIVNGICEFVVKHKEAFMFCAEKSLLKMVNFTYDRSVVETVFYDNIYEIIADYDSEKGIRFSDYIISGLAYKLSDYLRKEYKLNKDLIIASPEGDEDGDSGETEIINNVPDETDYSEAETGEIILQFCLELVRVLNGTNRDKARIYRMFYTEQYISFCDEFGIGIVRELKHRGDLWNNLDEILLECVYKNKPVNAEDIVITKHKNLEMLSRHFNGRDGINPEMLTAYQELFESCRDREAEINAPFENRIFIASDFIRQHDIESIDVPSAKSSAYISMSKRGRFNKDGSVQSVGGPMRRS